MKEATIWKVTAHLSNDHRQNTLSEVQVEAKSILDAEKNACEAFSIMISRSRIQTSFEIISIERENVVWLKEENFERASFGEIHEFLCWRASKKTGGGK